MIQAAPLLTYRYMEQRLLLTVILVGVAFTEIKCIQGCFFSVDAIPVDNIVTRNQYTAS